MNRIDALPRRIRLLGNQQLKRVDGHRKVPGELLNHLQVTLCERIHVGTFDVKRTDHIIMQNERHRQRTFRANQTVKIKRILGCIFAQIAFSSRRDKPGHAIAMWFCSEHTIGSLVTDSNGQQGFQKIRLVIQQTYFDDVKVKQIVRVVKDIRFQQLDSLIHRHLVDLRRFDVGKLHTGLANTIQLLPLHRILRHVPNGDDQLRFSMINAR